MKNKEVVEEVLYQPPSGKLWTGRTSNSDSRHQYWYQEINQFDININSEFFYSQDTVALFGYACDEGVIRNYGRSGARFGPDEVRKSLAGLPIHFENKTIVDVGNVFCSHNDLESTQSYFSKIITRLLQQKIFPVALGGGHDMSFGHYQGIRNFLKDKENRKVCIINLDAHFDLRPIEQQANSGTPFNQIFSELLNQGETLDYVTIGIQQQANTRELFDIAESLSVTYLPNYECEPANFAYVKSILEPIISRNNYIYLTIDMDSFSSAYAPGVSAPSPLGFTPYFALKLIGYLLSSRKVISCDIAELNPEYDRDDTTARLVARLVDYIVYHN